MKKNVQEVLDILEATQSGNKLFTEEVMERDSLSKTIYDIVMECKDENDEVDLEDLKDRLGYAVNELTRAGSMAYELFNEAEKKKEAQMQDFEIEVVRVGYSFKTISVRATSQEEAEALALDEAGSHEFSEKDADYKIND